MTQLNKILSVTRDELDALDLSENKGQEWFAMSAGAEHYRLLAYIGTLFKGEQLLDIGSYLGDSAQALAYSNENFVVSYDVEKHSDVKKENIHFIIGNILERKDLILQSPFILLDTFHNGDFEQAFVDLLKEIEYKGLVLFDDIYFNEPMQQFWYALGCEKYDLTDKGHYTGTGLTVWK